MTVLKLSAMTVLDPPGPAARDTRRTRKFARELKKMSGSWHSVVPNVDELREAVLQNAHGTHVLLLGAHDLPSDELVERLSLLATTHPTHDIIYGNAERVVVGAPDHVVQVVRPRWSPTRLLHENFIGDTVLVRTSFLLSVTRAELFHERWNTWDFLLASIRAGARVGHDPAVWTTEVQQKSSSGRPPKLLGQATRAALVQNHLERMGSPRIARDSATTGRVEIIPSQATKLPNHSFLTLTAGAADSALYGGKPFIVKHLETVQEFSTDSMDQHVVVVGPECDPAIKDSMLAARSPTTTVVDVDGDFNFASRCNAASQHTTSEFLIFTNDDFIPSREDWVAHLLAPFEDKEVGITGATLLYEDGSIQHAGHKVVGGNFFHSHHAMNPEMAGWSDLVETNREVDAVTGACFAVRRSVFDRVGGFFEGLPFNYNDVDLCLKVRRVGYTVVHVGTPLGTHHESKTRPPTVLPEEVELFFRRWPERAETSEYPFLTEH